jgi:integrase
MRETVIKTKADQERHGSAVPGAAGSCRRKRRQTVPDTDRFRLVLERFAGHQKSLGRAQGSVRVEVCLAGEYLVYLESEGVLELDDAKPETVLGFVSCLRQTWKPTSIGIALSQFRPFVRFLGREDLVYAAESIRAPRKRAILPILAPGERGALWSALQAEGISKRDRAIVLLGLLTGMRACDIVTLRLGDIDWRNDTISIIQHKTGNPLVLPLTATIGNAIMDYIADERPASDSSEVFLRKRGKAVALTSSASVYQVVRSMLGEAGIDISAGMCGTRMLRHNAATSLLLAGVPLPTISAVLGHAAPASTDTYLSVDSAMLKKCVLPLVEGQVRP